MIGTHRTFMAAIIALALAPPALAEVITTGSLIKEMVDMHRLAGFPDPAFRTIQYSSYDHRSTLPGGPDWFANSDGFGGEPVPNFEAVLKASDGDEPGEYLICDVEGPGAIVRCWTAAIAGEIRMYLDGADEPVFDGTADDFLRRPYNVFAKTAGVVPTVFDDTFNQRNATYCPIPFAKRCRIVWIGPVKHIHFYEVQMRLYEPDAEVVTFRPEDLKTYERQIRRVAPMLASANENWAYRGIDISRTALEATAKVGKRAELLKLEDGAKAVERLTLRVKAEDVDLALRQTILIVKCDNWPHGQVECPIGDFFGAAPGINPYDSVPFTVEGDGTMTCRFVMPFKESIIIEIDNRGDQPVTVAGSAILIPFDWDDEKSMHFRARWRVDHDLVATNDPPRDITFLVAGGAGRYVGTTSLMLNPTDVPTPAGGWWGEGDEKIFVDGEDFPSTFGTGSEDYYNYAWSSPDIFGFAYCGQPRNDGPGNRGFVTNQRWHVVDSLPFKERLMFFMELYSHKRTPGFSYARVAYHYGRPGLMDDHMPITDEDVRPLELPPNWIPLDWWGAANSVFLEPETLLGDEHPDQWLTLVPGNLYSKGRALVWKPAEAGETLTLMVPIEEEGKYSVDLCAVKTDQGGRFRMQLKPEGGDGEPILLKEETNLEMPHRRVLRRISGERVDLKPGNHVLELVFTGEPGEEIGIDFVWVQKR